MYIGITMTLEEVLFINEVLFTYYSAATVTGLTQTKFCKAKTCIDVFTASEQISLFCYRHFIG